jgi:hypothetical protein
MLDFYSYNFVSPRIVILLGTFLTQVHVTYSPSYSGTHVAIKLTVCSLLFVLCVLVVGVDLPWDSSQVAEYGEHFEEWEETQIKSVIRTLKDSLLVRPWSIVV